MPDSPADTTVHGNVPAQQDEESIKTSPEWINFFCSNGHALKVRITEAGKKGSCKKCKEQFVIPTESQTAPLVVVQPIIETTKNPITSKSPVGENEKAFTPPVVPPVVPASVLPRENAPVIFALPSQEIPEVPITLDDPDLNRLFDSVNESAVASSVHASLSSIRSNIVEVPLSQQSSTLSASVHPTASLVARLWEERRLGGVVEIHMAGGGMIIPDWYDEKWSRGTHGLFASQAQDESVTLTAVAWDSILKIIVRKLKGVPDGMFE
jgi:hypothetical protein